MKTFKISANELREKFLNFFNKNNHPIVDSSSVVPFSDPTLLFANSGMVQFKNNFLSIDDGTKNATLKRATSSQRCIRAGGKHNDLSDVGKDTYHHTFFEMLGNWSFGDYFKEMAIKFAYEFLIEELKLDKSRIYVTYFGEEKEKNSDNIEDDEETKKLWLKYFDEDKIIKFGKKDNFWEMGETGPCGRCTEIHYDRIGNRDATNLVNMDDPTVIEIWNLVFMEFYNDGQNLSTLKKKSVDTGMGMERVLGILNDGSNYQTDLFESIFNKMNMEYTDSSSQKDILMRIVADHCRTISVCLNDDVVFSSEGRGYVLRRIMRRLIKTHTDIKNKYNEKIPKLSELIKFSAETINIQLDEMKIFLIEKEVSLFEKTLEKGKQYLEKHIKNSKILSGEECFVLYDTYGFPIDLTTIFAEENNIEIDLKGFDERLKLSKLKSRKEKLEEIKLTNTDLIQIEKIDKNISNNTEFNLIHKIEAKTFFVKTEKNIFFDSFENLKESENFAICFDKTNFYFEKGGQVGDTGVISFINDKTNETVGTFKVRDTQIENNKYVLHFGNLDGFITKNGILEFDSKRRQKICCNHTATHLLNSTIKQVVNNNEVSNECYQKGSLVDNHKLRFDLFSHKSLTLEQLEKIEKTINEKINQSINLNIKTQKLTNLSENIIKLKNENYPEEVRVVSINDVGELCGGTHVNNTSDIKKLRIISYSQLGACTTRILAYTGEMAEEADKNYEIYKSLLEKGENVNLEETIPYLKRKELEIVKQELTKKSLEKIKKSQKLNTQKIKELNFSDDEVQKFDYIVDKELSESEALIAYKGIFKKIGKVGNIFVTLKQGNKTLFTLIGNNIEKEVERLKNMDNCVIGGARNKYSGSY